MPWGGFPSLYTKCLDAVLYYLILNSKLQDLFPQQGDKVPDLGLEMTVEAYPISNKGNLKTEMSMIYEK